MSQDDAVAAMSANHSEAGAAMKAGDSPKMAHGNQAEVERARGIPAATRPKQIETRLRAPSGSMAREPAPV